MIIKHGIRIRMGGAKEGISLRGLFNALYVLFMCLIGKEKYAYDKFKKKTGR